METKLRQRVIGGIVLAALAIIFLPVFFKGSNVSTGPHQVNISEKIPATPPKPDASDVTDVSGTNTPDDNRVVTLTQQGDSLVASVAEKPAKTPAQPASANAPAAEKPVAQNPMTPTTSTTNTAPDDAMPVADSLKQVVASQIQPDVVKKPENSKSTDEAGITKSLNAAEDRVLDVKPAPKINLGKQIAVKFIKQKPKAVTLGGWAVQLGAFEDDAHAASLVKQLKGHGFAAYEEKIKTKKGNLTRVLIGPETKRAKAELVLAKLEKDLQVKGVIVPFEVKLLK